MPSLPTVVTATTAVVVLHVLLQLLASVPEAGAGGLVTTPPSLLPPRNDLGATFPPRLQARQHQSRLLQSESFTYASKAH